MFLLKTKIRRVFRLVEIDENEKDIFEFVKKVFAAHNIEFDENVAVEFFENDGAPVTVDHLFKLIEQQHRCASFSIEFVPMGETHKKITTAVSWSSKNLKTYWKIDLIKYKKISNWKAS